MGLDGVELVMEWEERCGVTISDGDAADIVTPEDAFILLRRLAADRSDETCRTQQAFHKVRRILRKRGHRRSTIKPETRWDSLEKPRALIGEVLEGLALNRHLPTSRTRIAITAAASIALIYFGKNAPIVGPLPSILGWIILLFAALGWFVSTHNPAHKTKTIGEFVTFITERHPNHFGQGLSDDELRTLIRLTTLEQLGLRAEQFGWDKRFVQDLGVD